jgi:hypothetical protein
MLFFKSRRKNRRGDTDSAQSGPAERAPRYGSLALVRINGYEGRAVLRNISRSGFRMESKTFVDMDAGTVYAMQISPEPSSGLPQFEISVEIRWIQSSPEKFAAGFMLTQAASRPFLQYVEYQSRTASVTG